MSVDQALLCDDRQTKEPASGFALLKAQLATGAVIHRCRDVPPAKADARAQVGPIRANL